jgi:hypothetical protein
MLASPLRYTATRFVTFDFEADAAIFLVFDLRVNNVRPILPPARMRADPGEESSTTNEGMDGEADLIGVLADDLDGKCGWRDATRSAA